MTIFAIKGSDSDDSIRKVSRSLRGGEGRFGWSYIKSADMRQMQTRIETEGWDSLSSEEQHCYHQFLLKIEPDDHVVYVNVPSWGECTLARVTGEYEFRWEDSDFNHRFPVDPGSVRTFDRNDAMVHPHLRARLKLPGRWWTIYCEAEFQTLLSELAGGKAPAQSSAEDNLRYLRDEIKMPLREVAEKIWHTHPNFDLEELMENTLERVPGVKNVTRHRGRADKGADLEVEIETIPGLVQRVVIQVKAYEGEIGDLSAVDAIRRTLDAAHMGLIISTATSASENFTQAMDQLREETGKPVALLHGAELAAFVLKHSP